MEANILNKQKKFTTAVMASILLASMSGIALAAPAFELETIVVEGQRKGVLPGGYINKIGAVGILGNKNTLDVPFTVTNFSEKNILDFVGPNQAIDNALVNMPSVTQVGTMVHQDFAIRGQYTDGSSAGFVNGVPIGGGQFNNPTIMAESVEILAGPNKVISGTFPSSQRGAVGMINFTSKKALSKQPIRYTQIFSGKSGLVEQLDVGRRFGNENSWGVRFNTEISGGNPSQYDAIRKQKTFYLNIDHQGLHQKTNLLIGHQDYKIEKGLRWFTLGKKVTQLPVAPKGSVNYSFDGIEKETAGTIAILNHEQDINSQWKLFLNGGLSKAKLKKNITGRGSCLPIIDNEGNFSGDYFTRRTPGSRYYGQIGLNGEVVTGKIHHEIVCALDKSWARSEVGVIGGYGKTNFKGPGGNIYSGLEDYDTVNIPQFTNYHTSSTRYWGWSAVDTMKYNKLELMLGLHKHNTAVFNYNEKDEVTKRTKTDAMCPSYALIYKPEKNLTLYASHAEYFNAGFVVGKGYQNEGAVIDPAKTKQNEIGIKYLNKDFLTTLAFFDTKAASAMAVYASDDVSAKPYYLNDAEDEYKGVELALNGKLSPKLNFMGGLMYLSAIRNKTEKGTYDGYRVNGVPKWNGVAALHYNPNKHWEIIGRGVYTGSAPIKEGTFTVPSHLTYDLGVKYKTKMKDKPLTLTAMCYNLTNKNYWIAYGSSLHVSSPRTLMLSAQFNF